MQLLPFSCQFFAFPNVLLYPFMSQMLLCFFVLFKLNILTSAGLTRRQYFSSRSWKKNFKGKSPKLNTTGLQGLLGSFLNWLSSKFYIGILMFVNLKMLKGPEEVYVWVIITDSVSFSRDRHLWQGIYVQT